METQPESDSQEMDGIVETAHVPKRKVELYLEPGDLVTEVKYLKNGWSIGTCRGKRGIFPEHCVKDIKDNVAACKMQVSSQLATQLAARKPPELRHQEPSGSTKSIMVKVTSDFEAEEDNHLSLQTGDIVEVHKREEDWLEGTLNDKTGRFPASCVEVIKEHKPPGKKIMGVGLGNIFSGGPIKLRSTEDEKNDS